jgi:hypothetical protein
MTVRQFIFPIICTSICLLWACDPPKEGCLDEEATNFDVTADRNCDNCCIAPQLVCTVEQKFNNKVWKPDSIYSNNLGQYFIIRSAAFYLSNFEALQNLNTFRVSDTLGFRVFGNAVGDTTRQVITDDVALVRRTALEYPIGAFLPAGFFYQLNATIGLDSIPNAVVPRYAPSGHPLGRQSDSLWLSRTEGFCWMQLVIQRDTTPNTPTDTLRFTAADFVNKKPLKITGTGNFFHEPGFDFDFKLTINYGALFHQINVKQSPISQIKSTIISNLPTSVAIDQ